MSNEELAKTLMAAIADVTDSYYADNPDGIDLLKHALDEAEKRGRESCEARHVVQTQEIRDANDLEWKLKVEEAYRAGLERRALPIEGE